VGARILRETPLNIVLVGGNEDREAAHTIETECGDRKRVLNLAGKLTLKQLAAVLKKAKLLLSNDSGPAHVAAATGTRTLSIFGRNEPGLSARRWRALGHGHQVVQKDVGCVRCLAHRCTIDFECLKAVSSEQVFRVLQGMLAAETEPAAL
jgi:ADP-heptose:LPS heptosyltransferase